MSGRRYPIHDMAHARNALSRVAQNGTPEEQKKVRAAVACKYPSLKKSLPPLETYNPVPEELEKRDHSDVVDHSEPDDDFKAMHHKHLKESPHAKTHQPVETHRVYMGHDKDHDMSDFHSHADFYHRAKMAGHKIHQSVEDDGEGNSHIILSSWKSKK